VASQVLRGARQSIREGGHRFLNPELSNLINAVKAEGVVA
jgi:hypothetical protein